MGKMLPKIVEDRLEQGAELHYFQWICGDVHHCPEAGVEVQCGRLSGWFPRFCRIFPGSHHVRYYGGKSAAASLSTAPNPECKYSDFDSPEIKEFAGMAGCDMPDTDLPEVRHHDDKAGL